MSGVVAAVAELKRQADAQLWADQRAAERIARRARSRGRSSRDPLARAIGDHALANSHLAAGRHAAADPLYQSAAIAYRARGRSREAATADRSRVLALLGLGRFRLAEAAARRAGSGFHALGDAVGEAKVLINLASVRHAQDRNHEAVALLERARPGFVASGDRSMVATIDLDRANSLSLLARFERSGPLYAAARDCFAALGADEAVARVDYNLAYDHFLQGRFHDARRLLRSARDEFRRAGSAYGLALAALDEAEIDLSLNLGAEGLQAASEARTQFLARGETVSAARASVLAAEALLGLGDEPRARELLAVARSEFRRRDQRSGLAAIDLLLAGGSSLPAAVRDRLAVRAALSFASLGLGARAAMADVVAGQTAIERGRDGVALPRLQRAVRRARRLGLAAVEHRAEHVLARRAAGRGEMPRALAHYLRAVAAYERLRSGIRSDEDRLAFAADKTVLFEEAMTTALDLDRPALAFELLERARARALVDLLAADPRWAQAVLRPGSRLSRRLLKLKRELASVEARGRASERRGGPVPAALGRTLRRVLHDRDAALAALAGEQPEAAYAIAGWPIASLESVQAALGKDRVLVAYHGDGSHLGAALVDAASVSFLPTVARRGEVARALDAFHFALRTARVDPGRTGRHRETAVEAALAPLAELHRLLIAPLLPALGFRSLVIVPDAQLHLVPFHALCRRRVPLFAEREVTTAPSATVLVRALARRPRTRGCLVVAVADEAAPAIAAEAEVVARALGGARRLEGARATAAALRREAPRAAVVHLAAHGVFDPGEPLFSGLRLGDGRLILPEVSALGLDARLVTLSACESALGTARGGEVLGLVRSFLQAGTRALVAALWPVSDSSTLATMKGFYARLAAGAGIAPALAAAALELREEQPHPYHWAPFMAIGDWGPLYWNGTSPRSRSSQ